MTTIEIRPLGSQGLQVAAQGFGAMGAAGAFYAIDESNLSEVEAESVRTIAHAINLSDNFMIDTAWIYRSQHFHSEELVAKGIKLSGKERSKIVIATKFGIDFDPVTWKAIYTSTPDAIRRQLNESLKRLEVDYVDLYYQHRQDPDTPIEVVAQTLKELVAEGKIKYVGYSEITGDELRRAHAIHPVTAIQQEWSLQTRDLEATLVPVARELGVGIVAYSPLGRGLLTQAIKSRADLNPKDWRLNVPRFQEGAIEKNAAADRLASLAEQKGCTVAQLSLAWVHARGRDVVPIPGTKSVKRLDENVAAASIVLSEEECKAIEEAVPPSEDPRYHASMSGGAFNSRL